MAGRPKASRWRSTLQGFRHARRTIPRELDRRW
jgi:hypothetical protein